MKKPRTFSVHLPQDLPKGNKMPKSLKHSWGYVARIRFLRNLSVGDRFSFPDHMTYGHVKVEGSDAGISLAYVGDASDPRVMEVEGKR